MTSRLVSSQRLFLCRAHRIIDWVPTLYFTGNGRDEPVPASAFAIYYVGIDRAEAAIPVGKIKPLSKSR